MFPRLFSSFLLLTVSAGMMSCASVPKGPFGEQIPPAPDYADPANWAALPDRQDNADEIPVPDWEDKQQDAAVDVFFLHPTTYTGRPGEKDWNADIRDLKTNKRTDEYPIRYQSTVFNGIGKIYAPRYRQAHLNCFFTKNVKDAREALDLAYADVRAAFMYYIRHQNQGRPFIIASHSQGTYHAKRLLAEFIDGQPLQHQLVVAYLAGLTVPADLFHRIPPCQRPDETGCFCSWRTFREGYIPRKLHFPDSNFVVTNPVTWDVRRPASMEENHLGSVLRDFKKIYPRLVRTAIFKDLLWINKPRFPGSFLLTTRNYHVGDYNFFYADIRKNALDRVRAFLDRG